jgi:hypothetical protein
MIKNSDLEATGNEAVVNKFEEIKSHLHGGTNESHERSQTM